MDCAFVIETKFLEFEKAMEVCLPKVDKRLIIELRGYLKEDDYPRYNLQIKLREGFNIK